MIHCRMSQTLAGAKICPSSSKVGQCFCADPRGHHKFSLTITCGEITVIHLPSFLVSASFYKKDGTCEANQKSKPSMQCPPGGCFVGLVYLFGHMCCFVVIFWAYAGSGLFCVGLRATGLSDVAVPFLTL